MLAIYGFHSPKKIEKKTSVKNLQFGKILLCYQPCVTVNKWCNFLNPYLLMVLMTITFNKLLCLSGSFLPEKFKDSDADFNLGMSIGAIEAMSTMGTLLKL